MGRPGRNIRNVIEESGLSPERGQVLTEETLSFLRNYQNRSNRILTNLSAEVFVSLSEQFLTLHGLEFFGRSQGTIWTWPKDVEKLTAGIADIMTRQWALYLERSRKGSVPQKRTRQTDTSSTESNSRKMRRKSFTDDDTIEVRTTRPDLGPRGQENAGWTTTSYRQEARSHELSPEATIPPPGDLAAFQNDSMTIYQPSFNHVNQEPQEPSRDYRQTSAPDRNLSASENEEYLQRWQKTSSQQPSATRPQVVAGLQNPSAIASSPGQQLTDATTLRRESTQAMKTSSNSLQAATQMQFSSTNKDVEYPSGSHQNSPSALVAVLKLPRQGRQLEVANSLLGSMFQKLLDRMQASIIHLDSIVEDEILPASELEGHRLASRELAYILDFCEKTIVRDKENHVV